MKKQNFQLRDSTNGRMITLHLEIADNLWRQTVGLMGRREFAVDTGLLIPHCNAIHTAFVRFPIDVIFLDRELVVVRVVAALSPWRVIGFVKGAKSVLELPAGTLRQRQITVGQQFTLAPHEPGSPDRQA